MALAAPDHGTDEARYSRGELERVSPKIGRWRSARDAAVGSPVEDQPDGTMPVTVSTPRLLPTKLGRASEPTATLQPIQSWEGVVLKVTDDTFIVRLVDLNGDRAEEEMELEKQELSDFDLELLETGAIFYWTIGYRLKLPRGARERVSQIRFRRLPAWSRREIAAAEDRAERLAHDLDW
jgi:hypothetical protein